MDKRKSIKMTRIKFCVPANYVVKKMGNHPNCQYLVRRRSSSFFSRKLAVRRNQSVLNFCLNNEAIFLYFSEIP